MPVYESALAPWRSTVRNDGTDLMIANQASCWEPVSFVAVERRDMRSGLGSPGSHWALQGLIRVRWQRSGFDQEVWRGGGIVSGNMRGGLGLRVEVQRKRRKDKIGKKANHFPPCFGCRRCCVLARAMPVQKLPVRYHSGNVVACGKMKRRGKTDRMQMACRCWNGNEMNGRWGVSARL